MPIEKQAIHDTLKIRKLIELGLGYIDKNSDRIESLVEKIAELSEKNNYQYGIAYAYILKSNIALRKSDPTIALTMANKALALALPLKIPNILEGCYQRLGAVYTFTDSGLNIADHQKALYYFNQQLFWATKSKNVSGQTSAYTQIALVNIELKKYDEALVILNRTYGILMQEKQVKKIVIYEGFVLNLIGRTLNKKGANKEAIVNLKKAEKIAEKYEVNRLKDLVYHHLGVCYYDLKDYKNAEKYFFKSYSLATNGNIAKSIATIDLMAKTKERLGDYKGALDFANKVALLKDSVRSVQKYKDFAELQTKYETKQKEQENKLLISQNAKIEAQKQNYLILTVASLILLLLSAWFYLRLKDKNEKLDVINQIKDRLFAIIAHNLKRPAINFQNIIGVLHFLIKKKQYTRLQEVGIEAEKASTEFNLILDNLFRWSLLQQGKQIISKEFIPLDAIIDDIQQEFLSIAILKGISFEVKCPYTNTIHGDRTVISSIIRNILSNAFKFTPTNGNVRINVFDKTETVEVRITDTGIGIPAELQKKIFQLNISKNRKGTFGESGSGLGLMLCKDLAELSCGKIEINSVENVGTEVILYLPKITKFTQEFVLIFKSQF